MKKKVTSSSFKSANTISKGSHKLKPVNTEIEKEKECYFCKETGHLRKNCVGFKNWLSRKGNIFDIFVCVESNIVYIPPESWWFDTGCTIHITNSLRASQKQRR